MGKGQPISVFVVRALRATTRTLFAAIVTYACASCAGHSAPSDDELVVALGANPTDLDPRFAPDAYSDRISRLIFSTLLAREGTGRLVGHLAAAVDQPDPQTYVVTVRDDVVFHDGSPLTALDVKATYEAIRDPRLGSVKRLFLEPVESIELADDRTVIFHLKRPHAPFIQVLASIGVAPANALRRHGDDFRNHLIGSGPFRFVEQAVDEHVVLQRNDEWFGGRAGIKTIRFKIVPDATVRILEVLHGSTDLVQNDLPSHVVERLEREDHLQLSRGESSMVKYLAFNLQSKVLSDSRVRQAIAHAIDREPIIRHKLRGLASPARSFLHPESWAYEAQSRAYDHDLGRAKDLLEAAGYPQPEDGSHRFKLIYRTSMDQTSIAVATILKRQLDLVGIDMEIRTNEWGVFFADIKQGNFDLYTLTAVGVNDPDWYSFVFHSASMPPNGANRPRYSNPRVDRLLDRAKATNSQDERAELYREVQRITSEALPLLPLWYQHNVAVMAKRVQGYEVVPDGDFTPLVHTTKSAPPGEGLP